jgi:hypothetical protein
MTVKGSGKVAVWWDNEKTLLLVSPELLAALPSGVPLESIMGRKKITGQDRIDGDSRFGFLAYGIRVRKAPK